VDWLNALQAALFVAVLVAGAFIGLQQGTIRTLRATNNDLRARRDDLEKDRAELTQDRERDAKRISDLEGSVRTLTNTVTAKDAIADLTARLEQHHTESMEVLTAIQQGISGRASGGGT
jgi:uncharacterized membrane-anchored protein YhcB (DUF1043 family)